MILNLVEICVWSPTIGINNGNKDIVRTYHESFELFLHMFDTPWDIWGFSFLFKLSDFMFCIIDGSEFILKSGNELLSFQIAAFLMLLHGQKYQIAWSCSLMLREDSESLCQKFDILFITWNCKSMVKLLIRKTGWSYLLSLIFGSFKCFVSF